MEQLIGNFQSFKIPRGESAVGGIFRIGLHAEPSRILNEISKIFPVTSIGGCANNLEKPEGDPGRGEPVSKTHTWRHLCFTSPWKTAFSARITSQRNVGALSRGSSRCIMVGMESKNIFLAKMPSSI